MLTEKGDRDKMNETQRPARELVEAVRAYLDEHYPLWRTDPARYLPDGLRVEMHPGIYHLVLRDPDTWNWQPSTSGMNEAFGLPVRITPELASGTWRLVLVTEDVKMGGRIAA